jgi:glyoxylase-like metal-dependent hydrolase (beta-lactamase superfamily II)
VVQFGGLEIRVVGTPGHTSDSLSFLVPADRTVLTGDTVLGRGTTVVAHPDGRLADYLASLRRLRDLAAAHEITTVLPGHGPVLTDALAAVEGYLTHRAERLVQVERAVAAGARTPRDVVERVYADIDRAVWPAAELSVRAQLDYLPRPESRWRVTARPALAVRPRSRSTSRMTTAAPRGGASHGTKSPGPC